MFPAPEVEAGILVPYARHLFSLEGIYMYIHYGFSYSHYFDFQPVQLSTIVNIATVPPLKTLYARNVKKTTPSFCYTTTRRNANVRQNNHHLNVKKQVI